VLIKEMEAFGIDIFKKTMIVIKRKYPRQELEEFFVLFLN
jgi:hypothetical protein